MNNVIIGLDEYSVALYVTVLASRHENQRSCNKENTK